MKRLYITLFALIPFVQQLLAQQRVTKVIPITKDASIANNLADPSSLNRSFPTSTYIYASAGTNNDIDNFWRSLIGLDLSSIPADANVIMAKIYLFGSGNNSSYLTSNSCWLKRIAQQWEANTVTWNNQPPLADENQVTLPDNIWGDYIADITMLVKDMMKYPGQGNSLMLMLKTESKWATLSFWSSDYSNITKHPKLEITYEINSAANRASQVNLELKDPLAENTIATAKKSITLLPGFSTNGFNFSTKLDRYILTPFKATTYSLDNNFIATQTYHVASTLELVANNGDITEEIQYMDGLGRPIQKVSVNSSSYENDIVEPVIYDAYGRETIKYMPYTAAGNGVLRSDPVTEQSNFYSGVHPGEKPYAKSILDDSPLNRVLQQGSAGNDWQPDQHPVGFSYLVNDPGEVMKWKIVGSTCTLNGTYQGTTTNGLYTADLSLTINSDENENKTKEFKNKQGQVILKATESSDGTLITQTYYVFDDFGMLRYVLPPEAINNLHSTTTLDPDDDFVMKWCFYYEYDEKKRMIIKQVPDADPVHMLYDGLDRLVLTQDGNLRTNTDGTARDQWLFTKYDIYNRPVITGLTTISSATKTFEQLQSDFASYTGPFNETPTTSTTIGYTTDNSFATIFSTDHLLSATYYDNYNFPGVKSFDNADISGNTDSNGNPDYFHNVIGKVTGSKTRVLNTNTWLNATNYYDNKFRVIQTTRDVYAGTPGTNNINKEVISNKYSFDGKILQTYQAQYLTRGLNLWSITIHTYNTYDHAGRLLKTEHQIGDDPSKRVTLSERTYNENGQLINKTLHAGLQSIDYKYNIRGWLTQINDPDNLGDHLFGMKLQYNNIISGLNDNDDALYDGNISAIKWKADNSPSVKAYGYSYDGLNRLLKANYGEQASGWSNAQYDEGGRGTNPNIDYDLNGNIRSLARNGGNGTALDNLDYRYDGNRLLALGTGGNSAPATDTYGYDNNGNLHSDGIKHMTVTYNLLNKPQHIDFGSGNYIDYIYDATGAKLRKYVYTAGSLTTTEDYAGSIVYRNNTFDYMLTGEGRVTNPSGNYVYEYNLKDHLGNTRVSFQANPGGGYTVIQRADYYAFGQRFAGYTNNDNKYLYNGKELQDELGLNWYDYGFRYYDPQICRFVSVDPLATDYPWYTPFQYAGNKPIRYVDLDGLEEWLPGPVTPYSYMPYDGNVTDKLGALLYNGTVGGVYNTASFLINGIFGSSGNAEDGYSNFVASSNEYIKDVYTKPITLEGVKESFSTWQNWESSVGLVAGAGLSKLAAPSLAPTFTPMQGGLDVSGIETAKMGTTLIEDVAVHGNSLKSMKPTWGYKLFSEDGTFLKNGITSKVIPEARYTKAFMSDKYMEAIPFLNRQAAYDWEYLQNQILRGPLNLNMH